MAAKNNHPIWFFCAALGNRPEITISMAFPGIVINHLIDFPAFTCHFYLRFQSVCVALSVPQRALSLICGMQNMAKCCSTAAAAAGPSTSERSGGGRAFPECLLYKGTSRSDNQLPFRLGVTLKSLSRHSLTVKGRILWHADFHPQSGKLLVAHFQFRVCFTKGVLSLLVQDHRFG